MTPITDLRNSIAAALLDEPRRLAIVFFHVAQGPEQPFLRLQGDTPPDYAKCIEASVRAAHKVHPDAHIVMLSDDLTEFDTDLPMQVIRLPVKPDWLMYERTRCQLAFTQAWEGPALHIDTDIVIQHPFHAVFKKGFDFAVTARPEVPGQHINGGMLLCKRPKAFAAFLTDLLRMYDAIAEASEPWAPWDLHSFRGGQLSLAVLLFDRYFGEHSTPWGRVDVLPADRLNRTYEPPPFAVHYKGHRKKHINNNEGSHAA